MNGQNSRIYMTLFSLGLVAVLIVLLDGFSPTAVAPTATVKVKQSPYTFSQTVKNIKQAIVNNNFKVVRETRSDNAHTIYFCNFFAANESINQDIRSGILLPCKIRIIQDKDKVIIATLNIESARKQLGIKSNKDCQRISKSINQIIEDSVI